MTYNNGICGDLLDAIPVNQYFPWVSSGVGAGEAIFGLAYVFNSMLMTFWIYQQRRNAQRGIDGAAMYVIFPIYIPFMIMSVISDLSVGVITFFYPITYDSPNPWPLAIAAAFVYGLQHFVLEGIAFTMMQYGCGYQAARKAAICSLIWSFMTFLDQLVVSRRGIVNTEAFAIDSVWNMTLFFFYLALWIVPEKYLFRRPSVIFYSQFWCLFRCLYIAADILQTYFMNQTNGAGFCIFAFGNMLLFAACKPYVIYSTLLSDSSWWQGLGHYKQSMSSEESNENNDALGVLDKDATRRTGRHRGYQQLRNPLMGMEVGFTEAQELAQEVDNLRSMGNVKLLNFAYITLRKSAPILGSGSSSKVYSGEYRGFPVAIKMLVTPDLNPEVIRRCCNEAQILSNIRHENIVQIYGVAVLPPSVCIVLEKCQYGSLSDVLRGSDASGGERKVSPLHLCRADKMFLALGCARGVEALHSFSQTLCHRDIKSFNFLVDEQLIVKIADLELGIGNDDKSTLPSSSRMMSSWQAPEVIKDGVYWQASDVYSLSLVLWEIISSVSSISSLSVGSHGSSSNSNLSPAKGALVMAFHSPTHRDIWSLLPFGDYKSQKEVRTKVLEGVRPIIPPGYDARYVELIERGWQKEAHLRPSASECVLLLQQCWLGCLHRHIFETSYAVDLRAVREAYVQHLSHRQQSVTSSSSLRLSVSRSFTFGMRHVDEGTRRNDVCGPRKPPSPELLSALSVMQLEDRWMKLEDEGAFLIVAVEAPNYILWATKMWSKITGYLLNEVLADDISVVEGQRTDRTLLLDAMQSASKGVARHVVLTHYRKDKSAFINSLHIWPIFATSQLVSVPIKSMKKNDEPWLNKGPHLSTPGDYVAGDEEALLESDNHHSALPHSMYRQSATSPIASFLGSLRYSSSTPRTSVTRTPSSSPLSSYLFGNTSSSSISNTIRGSSGGILSSTTVNDRGTGSIGSSNDLVRPVVYLALQFNAIVDAKQVL